MAFGRPHGVKDAKPRNRRWPKKPEFQKTTQKTIQKTLYVEIPKYNHLAHLEEKIQSLTERFLTFIRKKPFYILITYILY